MILHPNTEFWNKGELITALEKFNIDQTVKVDGDGREKSNIAPVVWSKALDICLDHDLAKTQRKKRRVDGGRDKKNLQVFCFNTNIVKYPE